MRRLALVTSIVVAAAATIGVVFPAAAQESLDRVTSYEESVPNRGLILSGVALLGATYGISSVVAMTSEEPADRALFVPIAGPWINLADRPGCGEKRRCNVETTYKVLLVADGIGQAVGALQIVGGLLFPAKRIVTKVGSIQVVPQVGFKTAGVTAFGAF